ncbi:hypothetical protein [Streptomyces sp. cmx-4-7]|uniref:GAP1-N2 domain-containing protein n=1 Tax=Streptomyces sp. cmx-4-7 TaxID=2790939 RepID=UPI00397F404D
MSLARLHHTSADGDGTGEDRGTAPGSRPWTLPQPGPVLTQAGPLLAYELPCGTPDRFIDADLRGLPEVLSFGVLSDGSRPLSRVVAVHSAHSSVVGFDAHAVRLSVGSRLLGGTGQMSTTRQDHPT